MKTYNVQGRKNVGLFLLVYAICVKTCSRILSSNVYSKTDICHLYAPVAVQLTSHIRPCFSHISWRATRFALCDLAVGSEKRKNTRFKALRAPRRSTCKSDLNSLPAEQSAHMVSAVSFSGSNVTTQTTFTNSPALLCYSVQFFNSITQCKWLEIETTGKESLLYVPCHIFFPWGALVFHLIMHKTWSVQRCRPGQKTSLCHYVFFLVCCCGLLFDWFVSWLLSFCFCLVFVWFFFVLGDLIGLFLVLHWHDDLGQSMHQRVDWPGES